jgi:diguanylate cyclase (GGDEF)-like protein/putative nucleotidyltransferase with HDIG domain
LVYNIFFWGVPMLTLGTYLLLLFFFALSRKDGAIYSFMSVLAAQAIWSAGSLLMKMQFPPNVLFWNKTMMLGLILSSLCMYIFISVFTNTLRPLGVISLSVLVLGCVIIDLTKGLVTTPEVIIHTVAEGGKLIENVEFSYELSPWAIPVYLVMLLHVVVIVGKIRTGVRLHKIEYRAIRPVLIGVILVFLGTVSNVVPFLGRYPIDLLTSLMFALLCYYAIYRNRLLEMKFMLTRGFVYSVFTMLIMVVYLVVAYRLNTFFSSLGLLNNYAVLILALAVALLFQPVLGLAKKFSELIFYRSEYTQRNALRNFNINISNSLSLTEISNEFIETINSAMNPRRTCLLLRGEDGAYETFNSLQRLNPMELRLEKNHPVVNWLREKNLCITRDELNHSVYFKSMWDSEMSSLGTLGAEVLVPLRARDELVGIILLTERRNNLAYTADDLDLLQSFGASAAMALSNAALYARAQDEANTDDMTGIYNRRYLFKYLREQLAANPGRQLSIIIFDLDRFKLYNELYGYTEGDNAIIRVANMLSRILDRRGICTRYSGEQFVAVLPDTDSAAAMALAETVRNKVQQAFIDDESITKQFLTTSAGICTYPVCALNSEQLLHRANLALLKAKENGKNTCVVYSSEQSARLRTQEPGSDEANLQTTIYALTAAIDAKDHYTFAHSQNVAKYAAAIARELGLDSVTQKIVHEAGLLHDVGKIGIPENILTKNARLTNDEYAIIQKHVDISINIVKHLPSMTHVIPAIVGHHERWDGRGYPRGISGERIPVEARCLAVADTFDAITSIRPYKTPLPTEYALQELERNKGAQFDPRVVDAFIRLVREGRLDVTPARHL